LKLLTKIDCCDTQEDYMIKFLNNELKGLHLEYFLGHVAKCDKCLCVVLKEKGIIGD